MTYIGRARPKLRNRSRQKPNNRPAKYLGSHRYEVAPRRRRALPLWQELPLLVLLAFGLALLVRTFLLQAFFIPTGSMEQTLQVGDRVLVNKVVYRLHEPERGDVVVFRGSDSWAAENPPPRDGNVAITAVRTVTGLIGLSEPTEKDFIKRVIGVPGDTVECCDARGRLMVNGIGVTEPYVYDNNPLAERQFGPITVPQRRLFVLGDHRGRSQDSRAYLGDQWRGTIPMENVIGKALVRIWPIPRWGPLGPAASNAAASSGSAASAVTVGPLLIAALASGRRRGPLGATRHGRLR